MISYYVVLAVIIVLVIVNYACLYWIHVLQKRIKHVHVSTHAAKSVDQPVPETLKLTGEQYVELQGKTTKEFEAAVEKSAGKLQEELAKTVSVLNQKVAELGDKVVQDELTKYQSALDEVRQASIDTLSHVQAAADKKRLDMEKTMEVEVADEKRRILERFDRQIGEVVSSYLVETLGSQVDLGAQSSYVFAALEEHKAELVQALSDGV
jgi:hypothetical protein